MSIIGKINNIFSVAEQQQDSKEFERLETLHNKINHETETLESFLNSLEEPELGNYFNPKRRLSDNPFEEEISQTSLEQMEETGLLDSHDFGGSNELYTITQKGIYAYENPVLENSKQLEEIIGFGKETANKLLEIDDPMKEEIPEEFCSKSQDERFIRQITDNGSSKERLTPKGEKDREKIESLDEEIIRTYIEQKNEYNPSPEDILNTLKQGKSPGSDWEKYKKAEEAIKLRLNNINSENVGNVIECYDLFVEAVESDEIKVVDIQSYEEELRNMVEGLKAHYQMLDDSNKFEDASNAISPENYEKEEVYEILAEHCKEVYNDKITRKY